MTDPLLVGVFVFVLALFVGFEVITKVPPTLHTPLMSGANAISGISIVGALVVAGAVASPLRTILGVVAVVMATINVVGGFMVTDRMLKMFRRRREADDGEGNPGDGGRKGAGGAGGTRAGGAGAGGGR